MIPICVFIGWIINENTFALENIHSLPFYLKYSTYMRRMSAGTKILWRNAAEGITNRDYLCIVWDWNGSLINPLCLLSIVCLQVSLMRLSCRAGRWRWAALCTCSPVTAPCWGSRTTASPTRPSLLGCRWEGLLHKKGQYEISNTKNRQKWAVRESKSGRVIS